MAEVEIPAVETKLNGYFAPDYSSNQKTVLDITSTTPTKGVMPPQTAHVYDVRVLQEAENDGSKDFLSKFFHKHGFVLLDHKSSVENWDSGAFPAADGLKIERNVSTYEGENQIASCYLPEIDALIRDVLLPGENLEIQQPPMLLRRGKNTANPFFGSVVHNDYGVTVDDYEENTAAFGDPDMAKQWRNFYDSNQVQGFMMINFWRPVHMNEPLQHMPLAILDADSVEIADLVSTGLKGFSRTGRITNQLSLRFNANQKWYYCPKMKVDEVLALKLFHCFKEGDGTFRSCYHSAFEDPTTPADAQERQSCEHRVNVFTLRS